MNERIRALKVYAKQLVRVSLGVSPSAPVPEELVDQKFAMLIVLECVGRVRYCIQNDLDYIVEDIEQHFGVE